MISYTETTEVESKVTGNIIQESLGKVAQALEIEAKKLREQAEYESKQIIAKARDEADRIVIQIVPGCGDRGDTETEAGKEVFKELRREVNG